MPGINGIAHVELSVRDLDKSVRWYCELLGAQDVFPATNDAYRITACAIFEPRSKLVLAFTQHREEEPLRVRPAPRGAGPRTSSAPKGASVRTAPSHATRVAAHKPDAVPHRGGCRADFAPGSASSRRGSEPFSAYAARRLSRTEPELGWRRPRD
jgi:catechol 2,3-dioxygenase-like lactoylglutathione lyase family enzyme